MAFEKASSKVPTSIGRIVVVLTEDPQGQPISKTATYQVQVLDQNGEPIRVRGETGDLVPHISGVDKAWLLDFMGRIRAKAEQEFLP